MVAGKNGLTYSEAGVDIAAGNDLVERIKPAAARTRRPGVIDGLGGFGALFDLRAAGFSDPVLVAATDGVGTKLRIAIDTGQVDGVGVDLVAMCVNDLVCQGAEPLFFLDYFATGTLDVDTGARVVEGIAEGCARVNVALIGGETAEMPGMYPDGDFDLAGFAVGAMERGNGLPREVSAGDALIGLASDGVHSNGFSLVRKVVERSGLEWEGAAPFGDGTLAAALLTPTRLYVRSVMAVLGTGKLRAAAHITGGGLTENLPRVLPKDLGADIDLNVISPNPVFAWLADVGGVESSEMLRTFNCGVGMVLVVPQETVDETLAVLTELGEQAAIIGSVTEGEGVRYSGSLF